MNKKVIVNAVKPPYKKNGIATTFPIRKKAGVYIIFIKTKVVYVGYSGVSVYNALYHHFSKWNDKRQGKRITYDKNNKDIKVRVIYTNSKYFANNLETALIIKLKPRDNKQQYWLEYQTEQKENDAYDLYTGAKIGNLITHDYTNKDLPF